MWYSFTIKSMSSLSGVEKVVRNKIDKLYVAYQNSPPKMCIPGACKYAFLYDKKDFASVAKIMDMEFSKWVG